VPCSWGFGAQVTTGESVGPAVRPGDSASIKPYATTVSRLTHTYILSNKFTVQIRRREVPVLTVTRETRAKSLNRGRRRLVSRQEAAWRWIRPTGERRRVLRERRCVPPACRLATKAAASGPLGVDTLTSPLRLLDLRTLRPEVRQCSEPKRVCRGTVWRRTES
jgi:hypothetical protein